MGRWTACTVFVIHVCPAVGDEAAHVGPGQHSCTSPNVYCVHTGSILSNVHIYVHQLVCAFMYIS